MTLIVFLRGVNVGGHRRFRPSTLAKELSDYGVVEYWRGWHVYRTQAWIAD